MMKDPFGGIILNIAFRVLVPFSIVYAVYVLIFGEISPGGGFQAGVALSVGVVFSRLILGEDAPFNISGASALILAGIGTFIFVFTGWISVLTGGHFLDYGKLPLRMEHVNEIHAMGILSIEVGVTLCVMATVITILDAIVKRSDDNGSA